MPLTESQCPTEGCRGMILCAVVPHHGEIAFCRPCGTLQWHCGRALAWDSVTERWVSIESLSPIGGSTA